MSKFDNGYAAFVTLSILVALGLRTPALSAGLLADDWDHYAMSAGIYPVPRQAFDHFNFIGQSPTEHRAFQRQGRLPWWSAPDLHVALFRPLSSLLGQLDYAWLDGYHHPSRAHFHSLVWWIVLVVGVAVLLPQLLPLPAAALGTLLYAFDDAHILPATWIANRSELVANAFVVWALYLCVRAARSDRSRRPLELGSLALVASALLAGEHAVPALAYVAAFHLQRREWSWRQRLRSLGPLLAIVASYLIARRMLGYGASGHGLYVEPFSNPARYLHACFERLPLLFGDVVFGVAAEWFPWGPPPGTLFSWLPLPSGFGWPPFQVAIGWLGLVLVIATIAWLARATEDRTRTMVGWMLLAAAASILPMCATVPMGRLTLPAALGVDVALAFGIYEVVRTAMLERRALQLVAAVSLVTVSAWSHIASAGVRAFREAGVYVDLSHLEENWVRLDGIDLRDRHVLIVTSGCTAQWVMPYVRHRHGLLGPRSSTPLSAAFLSPHELIRSSAGVIELRMPTSPIGATFTGSVYRSGDEPFHTGDHIVTPNFDVTVLAAERGEPTWLRFAFPTTLDDARYLFLFARPEGLSPLTLPKVGERISLPIPTWPTLQPLRTDK